ncbi:MAG: hypothetical protein L0214_11130, partial [candidate division NC10 bacterium]|nr:hypothetical protein [candidate division NC10 bacterium]
GEGLRERAAAADSIGTWLAELLAPEHLVQETVAFFQPMGVSRVEELDGIREDVVFALPPEIQRDLPAGSKAARSLRVLGRP